MSPSGASPIGRNSSPVKISVSLQEIRRQAPINESRNDLRPLFDMVTSFVVLASRELQPAIDAALELAIERDHARVEEGQDLREERARDPRDRIEPEVTVQQAAPGDAAGRAPVGAA